MLLFIPVESVITEETYVIRYSHLGVADPNIQASSAKAVVFKAELERLTGGRMRVDIFPSGQLAGQVSSVQQVRKGTIHIADISSGVLASLYYEPLEVFDMPYLFSSRTTARIVLDNETPFTKKLIEGCVKKSGVRILSLGLFGYRHMTNNVRQIRTPDDMKGLKMRTMEIRPHMKLMESCGARPIPIPWLELYTSLQTKVVDGEETTLQNIVMGKLYQVQRHLTLTGHVMGVGAFLCNEKWFQSLPDDLRAAVIEAEKVSLLKYDRFGEELDKKGLEKLKSEMKVYEPTAEQMQKFRDKALPYVREWMEKKHGKKLVAEFFASIEAAEEQLMNEKESAKVTREWR
jgi:C4-dicarboxylate-binding protein DctP